MKITTRFALWTSFNALVTMVNIAGGNYAFAAGSGALALCTFYIFSFEMGKASFKKYITTTPISHIEYVSPDGTVRNLRIDVDSTSY